MHPRQVCRSAKVLKSLLQIAVDTVPNYRVQRQHSRPGGPSCTATSIVVNAGFPSSSRPAAATSIVANDGRTSLKSMELCGTGSGYGINSSPDGKGEVLITYNLSSSTLCKEGSAAPHPGGGPVSVGAKASSSRSSASRQSGVSTPNTWRNLVRSNREFAGRCALVG
jgi:hypothetical protein